MDINYFKNELENETNQLKKFVCVWEEKMKNGNLPESVCGDINVAVGLANLLMKQRFQQFRQLITDCEFQTGLKDISCDDLQGFWDMVYFQIEDVKRHFSLLDDKEKNNWEEEKENAPLTKIQKSSRIKTRLPTLTLSKRK